MTDNADELLRLIHDTRAVSIWDRHHGPVFWFANGTPGPFYVNTEQVVGASLAEDLLRQITATLADISDKPTAAARIGRAVMAAYDSSTAYQRVIRMLADTVASSAGLGDYDLISGGERRDWFFSIPLAHLLGKRHLFLFKDRGFYCEQDVKPGEQALHIVDLINNGASFFDYWFPALKTAGLSCIGTACILARGPVGVDLLKKDGHAVIALHTIDKVFFEKLHAVKLIDRETLAEILSFYESPARWGEAHLCHDTALFDVKSLDYKSLGRLQSFLANDPWNLRGKHEDLFSDLEHQMALRASSDEGRRG